MRRTARTIAVAGSLTAACALSTGCSNAGEGALSGAGLGAGAGAIIGSMSGDAGVGAIIGAVAGGLLGGVIGDQNERAERNSYNSRSTVIYHDYRTPRETPSSRDYGYEPDYRSRDVYRDDARSQRDAERDRYASPPR